MSSTRCFFVEQEPLSSETSENLEYPYVFQPEESKGKAADSHSAIHGNLLFVAASRDEKDWPSELHSHYFSELFYITGGNGEFKVNSEAFQVHADDLVILNPNTMHTEFSSSCSPLSYIVIGIDGISFSSDASSFHVIRNSPYKQELQFYFQVLFKEIQSEQRYHKYLCTSLLNIILVYLSRDSRAELSLAPNAYVSQECADAKQYMDTHFREAITLDVLAAHVHWNKYHLSHCFTRAYDISPIQYLLEKRIKESKYLLRATNYPLSAIAAQTGFSSPSYFSQSFRKLVKIAPLEYRKKCKTDS